jgi:hypothetical protein
MVDLAMQGNEGLDLLRSLGRWHRRSLPCRALNPGLKPTVVGENYHIKVISELYIRVIDVLLPFFR